MSLAVHDLLVGVTAAVGNPGSTLCPNNRIKGSDHTAGGDNIFDFFACIVVYIRLTVGYNNELVILEFARNEFF